jgi:hypothetical protein
VHDPVLFRGDDGEIGAVHQAGLEIGADAAQVIKMIAGNALVGIQVVELHLDGLNGGRFGGSASGMISLAFGEENECLKNKKKKTKGFFYKRSPCCLLYQ